MIRAFSLSLLGLLLCFSNPAHAADAQKPISPDSLKKFLPVAPEGWKVVDISSQNNIMSEAATTTAQCRYVQADAKEASPDIRIDLQINDWVNRAEVLRRMIRLWAVTNDKDDASYIRGTVVAGYPAEETYDHENNTHSITLIVGGRYCINLDVYGRPPGALIKWLDRVDLKTLATAK
jgi:hypothetical protein